MTVTESLDRFIVQLEADGRSMHTIGQYRRHVRLLVTWLVCDGRSLEIESTTHEDLAQFLASDMARLRPDGHPKKATSVNTLRSSLRTYFRFCHDAGYVRLNPARLIRRALCAPPPPRALTEDEQRRLLETPDTGTSFESRRDAALVRTMLGTGLRLSSALGLRVEDLELVAREIEIRSSKGDRPDRLPISTEVTRVLTAWVAERTEGPLFGSRSGDPLSPRHLQRRFRAAVERAGITASVSPHSMRHAFATRLLARTGDITLVQAALRHRSIVSTLIYARVCPARLRAAIG